MKKLIAVLFIVILVASYASAAGITNYMGPYDGTEIILINYQNLIPSPVTVTSSINCAFGFDIYGTSFVYYDGDTYLQFPWVAAPNSVVQREDVPLIVLQDGQYYNSIFDGPMSNGQVVFKLGW